jgi:hypothetical protein
MASSIGGSALTALQKLHQSASNVTAPTGLTVASGLSGRHSMRPARISVFAALALFLAGCGSTVMHNASTGKCESMPRGLGYVLMGGYFAVAEQTEKWRCDGLQVGDMARIEKPRDQ